MQLAAASAPASRWATEPTQVWVCVSQIDWTHSALLVHGPSPTAKPHALVFGSHTDERQTRCPTATEQVATVVGVPGSWVPFVSLASHVPLPPGGALHHCEDRQSASVVQADVQRPLVVSQTLPMCPAQSALVEHLPHVPTIEPVRKQKGSSIVPQGSVAVLPKSPLHVTQVDELVLHTGSSLGHVAEVVHWTHVSVAVLQVCVAPEHCELRRHATHSPWFAPVVAQIVERHSTAPSAPVQGPSPFA